MTRTPPPDRRSEVDRLLEAGDAAAARAELAALWRESPGSATAGFVLARAERLAALAPTGAACPATTTCRVAFLRSFTVEPAVTLLRAGAAVAGIDVHAWIGDFNAWVQPILDEKSALYAFAPDVVVLAVQTRDVAPELWSGFPDRSPAEVEATVERVVADFAASMDALRARSTAQLLVHGLEAPPQAGAGLLDGRVALGQAAAVARINAELGRLARDRTGVYLLDYDGLVARHGRLAWQDEAKWLAMRMPIAAACLPHLATEWLRFLHPLTGRLCKALVVDLDNTLWGGVIGEDGPDGIALGVEYPGAAFRALQRTLLDVHARGVLLAIASKNNPDDAREALERHPEMLLRPEHFAATRIGWGDKAQSLRELAAELHISLDAIAFLDDNPTERQWVRTQLPEVTVIELPADPLRYADVVRACASLERLTLSQEDRDRGRLYAADRRREELRTGTGSVEDFYRSLEMVAEIAPVAADSLPRAAQLTQKTNQFNLTTRRWSEPELARAAGDPAWRALWLRVRDRFGDHGVVGVAIAELRGPACEIDTFLLSCRVIGRTVETALFADVAAWARARGAERLTGWFRPTAKNAPARGFYAAHGFTLVEEKDGASFWSLDLGRLPPGEPAFPPWPPWIARAAPRSRAGDGESR